MWSLAEGVGVAMGMGEAMGVGEAMEVGVGRVMGVRFRAIGVGIRGSPPPP
jgi:hypothetical protein